jgi:hypothetical protein
MYQLFFKVMAFIGMFAFLYQSYDSFRSALTDTQPKASAPNKNPEGLSDRAAGFVWGVLSFILAGAFSVAI